MSVQERINNDLAISMREGVAIRTAVLRLLKNALQQERIKLGHDLSDNEELAVLKREAKQRRDSIEQYEKGGREDLVASEKHEMEIIAEYLPEMLSEAEISNIIEQVVVETKSTNPKEMGVVIGAVMQRAGGRADGAVVSRLVRERLSNAKA